MSIRQATRDLAKKGRLILRHSSFLNTSARKLYVTPEIDGYARKPFADTIEGERFAELAAFFDAFSEMNMISVSENPNDKPPDVMLARVRPVIDDFWSMRVTDPLRTPGIRVLGGFCATDEFVALSWDFRENISDFDSEVDDVKARWMDYFGTLRPHQGSKLDDYLTNFDPQ